MSVSKTVNTVPNPLTDLQKKKNGRKNGRRDIINDIPL